MTDRLRRRVAALEGATTGHPPVAWSADGKTVALPDGRRLPNEAAADAGYRVIRWMTAEEEAASGE